MKRSLKSFVTAAAGIGAALLLSTAAEATPPATVVGTWSLVIDHVPATLDITNQGGPGQGTCRIILGTLGVAPIRGIYCPPTGHIHILHNNLGTGATVRTFTGAVSDATPNSPAEMSGTVHVVNVAFGPFGEYPFAGVR